MHETGDQFSKKRDLQDLSQILFKLWVEIRNAKKLGAKNQIEAIKKFLNFQ